MRHPGAGDPVLRRMLDERGLDEAPVFVRTPRKVAGADWPSAMTRWTALAKERDGPVNPVRSALAPEEFTRLIKSRATELDVADSGCAVLTPTMVAEGVEFDLPNIVSLIVAEDYAKVLGGALAVEAEAVRVYVRCAEVSTALAAFIRDLGYRAVAEHNGTGQIQAIPALYASGLGELGKHGSLIHPIHGAGFRPSFVLTDAPVVLDQPNIFGVQDWCMNCNLCANNCPPAAIPPSGEFIWTEGVKRWLTDIEKCYQASRLREEYCHICVDVCPYVHKETGDPAKLSLFKAFMAKRRRAGYRTPAWFLEDEPNVLEKS
jgi:ferredoxin